MRIIINDRLVSRRRRQAVTFSLAGLAILAFGLALSLIRPQQIAYAYSALVVGTLVSWLGIALSDTWLRVPRADAALAEALKGSGRAFSLYHWALPADHVLLTPFGVVVLLVYNQAGPVSVRGERWQESRPLWRRLFSLGRRPVRNPQHQLELQVDGLRKRLREALPEADTVLEDVPFLTAVLFSYPRVSLTVESPSVPALRSDELRAWLREMGKGRQLSPALRRTIEIALDKLAGQS